MGKKILVVGCGAGSVEAKKIIAELGHDNILFAKTLADIPEDYINVKPQRAINIIRSLPKLDLPFYPKQKHSPKGHQRKYKFHP